MALLPPLYQEALIFASLLTLLSSGLTLTYLTTRVPNFAHGSFATIGAYVGLTSFKVFQLVPYYLIPLAFILSGVVSLALYKLIMRPLMAKGSSVIFLMIATIAYDMILLSALNIYADYLSEGLKITSRYFSLKVADIRIGGPTGTPMVFFSSILSALLVIIFLHLLLTKTKFGVAMRATIENPMLAGVVGINTDLVYTVSWFMAGGLAGLAGVLISLWFIGNPDLGSLILVSIFAASIVGGFNSIYGAFLGGYLVGFAEIVGQYLLTRAVGPWVATYRPVIPLIIMVVTLLVVPYGLAGVRWREVLGRFRREG